jgi:hypothetical protein
VGQRIDVQILGPADDGVIVHRGPLFDQLALTLGTRRLIGESGQSDSSQHTGHNRAFYITDRTTDR